MKKDNESVEEKGWFDFETRVDEKGRLSIPPDIREELGIYRKPAKVEVKVKVVKLYVGGGKHNGRD